VIQLPTGLKCKHGGPDKIFRVAHWFAVFVLVYACAWSFTAIHRSIVPDGAVWQLAHVTKLGYPMVPVILYCWFCRHKFNNNHQRMTPGYYFANLKMALMPSLGPGLIIGAILKFLVLKLGGVGDTLGETYSEFLLPVAWLMGCVGWYVYVLAYKWRHKQSIYGHVAPDWGHYERWVIKPDPSKKWQDWVVKGPHWLPADNVPIIPAAELGTFEGIAQADMLRTKGITICCLVAWSLLIIFGLWAPSWINKFDETCGKLHPWMQMLIHTDFINILTNTLTAPILVHRTWRCEPVLRDAPHHKSMKAVWRATKFLRHITTSSLKEPLQEEVSHALLVENDERNYPLIMMVEDEQSERDACFKELIQEIRGTAEKIKPALLQSAV